MALICQRCGREYDVALFEFGRVVRCDCGNIVDLKIDYFNQIKKFKRKFKSRKDKQRK